MKGMQLRSTSQLILFASLLLAGCAPNTASSARTPDPAADRQQIEVAANRIWSAVAKNDAAAVLAEYGDDAILMGGGAPMIQGKPAISKFITDLFKAISFRDVGGKILDVTVSGDLAIETGTYSWTVVPASGSPMPDKGKYIHVWARSPDGAWKVIRYIVNSDVAPQ